MIPPDLRAEQIKDELQVSGRASHLTKVHLDKFDQFFTDTFLQNRVQRFQQHYFPALDPNNDIDEPELSKRMLFDDLRELRQMFQTSLTECLNGQVKAENQIARINSFFMEKMAEKNDTYTKLTDRIAELEHKL